MKSQHYNINKSIWRHQRDRNVWQRHVLYRERKKYSHSGCEPGEAQARCWGKVRHSGKTGPDWQLTLNSDAAPPHLWQAQVSTSTSYILRNDTIGYYLQNTSDDDEEQEAHQSRVSSAERGRRSSWLEDTGSFHRPSLKRPAPSSLGVEEWTQVLYRITTLVCNGITFY